MKQQTTYAGAVITLFTKAIDILVVALLLGVLVVIVRQLYTLFVHDLFSSEIRQAIDNGLFILILLELFVILIYYMRDKHIKVERVIELGIISIVRDIIFHIFDIEILRLLGLAVLLFVLGIIFFVEKKFSQREHLQVQTMKS